MKPDKCDFRSLLFWSFATLTGLFLPTFENANAYPNFISYGYNTCITCHYNGAGGGALNDYGKALFATEITSRMVFSKKRDEESIGEKSGLFGWQSPHWFKPGLKFRGLWLQNNPGKENESEKMYEMQYDINLTSAIDEDHKYVLASTMSYLPTPRITSTFTETGPADWFLKEFYLRYQASDKAFLYAGLLDKVYGIRHANHTSYNRGSLGLGQFDQSVGLVIQVLQKSWEMALNGFAGHPKDLFEKRQKGGSLFGELQVKDHTRLGGSFLVSSDDSQTWLRAGPHVRSRIGKGNSIMAEVGIKEDVLFEPFEKTSGHYAFLEFVGRISRGYNYTLNIEQFDRDSGDPENAELIRYGLGFLLFPLPGTEFRMSGIKSETVQSGEETLEFYQLQAQIHFSW